MDTRTIHRYFLQNGEVYIICIPDLSSDGLIILCCAIKLDTGETKYLESFLLVLGIQMIKTLELCEGEA